MADREENKEVYSIAKLVKELHDEKEQFKEDNASVFEENKRLCASLKEIKSQLFAAMKEHSVSKVTYDGVDFECKSKSRIKHDLSNLTKRVADYDGPDAAPGLTIDSVINSYVSAHTIDASDVFFKKPKKQKTG